MQSSMDVPLVWIVGLKSHFESKFVHPDQGQETLFVFVPI